MIDEIPMGGPGQVPDFTPFFQRAKDKKPDVFFVFVPAGDHALGVLKTYGALGMRAAGIKLIGPGDITQDIKLQAMGDNAVGLITIHHYNADLDNPVNKRLVEAWKKEYGPNSTPDFMGVQGYDGMAAIAHVVTTLKGKIDPDAAINALQGLEVQQPARADLDRSAHPRHRHERVPQRNREEGRAPLPEEHRRHHGGQGHVQGAGRGPLQAIAEHLTLAVRAAARACRGGGFFSWT